MRMDRSLNSSFVSSARNEPTTTPIEIGERSEIIVFQVVNPLDAFREITATNPG
jgi:hypothetical protein